jgi:hypothetical protein
MVHAVGTNAVGTKEAAKRMVMKMTARKTQRTGRMAKGKRTLLNTRWSIVIHATAMANAV